MNSAIEYLNDLKHHLDKSNVIKQSHYFAGVGHRKHGLSQNRNEDEVQIILNNMKKISQELVGKQYCLRSGHADGSDKAFEQGALLVNEKINSNRTEIFKDKHIKTMLKNGQLSEEQYQLLLYITAYFHPLKEDLLKLPENSYLPLMRNYFQVMGDNLTIEGSKPIKFALCFTNDGCENHIQRSKETGGTGQFISYADFFNIPIINMKNNDWQAKLFKLIK